MGTEMNKKDNRGMSLVEILIVIALMAVIAGFAGYGLSMISNKPVEECAKKIEIALNRDRVNSMGKSSAWLEFYMEDGRLVVVEYLDNVPGQPQTIGAEGVHMKITYDLGSYDVTETGAYRVAFERDSGAVKAFEIKVGGSAQKCKEIVISKGSFVKTIKLDTLTGRVNVE